MTVAEWESMKKWLTLDDVFLLRDLVFNNMQFCDTEEEREQYQKTFDRLTIIQDEVIPF